MRSALFPGLNLHARERYVVLPRYISSGAGDPSTEGTSRSVLDAGSGNGMLAYKSWLLGNEVIAVSFNEQEVAKASRFFNEQRGISPHEMRFLQANLYEIEFAEASFDEIICAEVLEHLRRDDVVCRKFFRLLKPGGLLHVCAPNAEHPYNAAFPLDESEGGGHVRAGYTLESYRRLLEPIGFRIEASQGLGGPVRQAFNRRIKETQARFGAAAGLPLFFVALPFLWLDRVIGIRVPYSIYVKAVKPA